MGLTFIPTNLDLYRPNYKLLVKIFARSGVENSLPWANFMKRPIAAVLTYKGCMYNCVTCGGSQHAYSLIGRRVFAVKKPATVVDEVRQITEWRKAPMFVAGDLQVLGRRYVEELAIALRQENLDAELIFEFFTPTPPPTCYSSTKKPPTQSTSRYLRKTPTKR